MPSALQAVLEVVKYILPSIVVFLAVYYIMKTYLDRQTHMRRLELEDRKNKETLPLKLQAYERLSLLCERMRIPMVAMRVRSKSMTADELGPAMMMAIQKEYEHNLTQQIYVSESLWKIITLAKDEMLSAISNATLKTQNGEDFERAINEEMSSWSIDPINQALVAIRKEVSLFV